MAEKITIFEPTEKNILIELVNTDTMLNCQYFITLVKQMKDVVEDTEAEINVQKECNRAIKELKLMIDAVETFKNYGIPPKEKTDDEEKMRHNLIWQYRNAKSILEQSLFKLRQMSFDMEDIFGCEGKANELMRLVSKLVYASPFINVKFNCANKCLSSEDIENIYKE